MGVAISVISRVWDGGLGRGIEPNIYSCQGRVCGEDWVEVGVFPIFGEDTMIGFQRDRAADWDRIVLRTKKETYSGKNLPCVRSKAVVANSQSKPVGAGNNREASDPIRQVRAYSRGSWI